MNISNRTLAIIGAVVVTLLIIGASIFANKVSTPKPSPSPTATPFVDVSAPKGPALPTFTSFDLLYNYGLASDQLDGLKYAFSKFAKASGITISTVSTTDDSIYPVTHDRFDTTSTDYIYFNALVNGKVTYKAKVAYHSVEQVRLYLSDFATDKIVFDSGDINLSTGAGVN